MPELRWILLALGALLIAGLWWWEVRRSRQSGARAIPGVDAEPRAPERFEPRLDAAPPEAPVELPSMRAVEDRAVPRGDPPVVTLDDLPEDPDQVVLAREPAAPRRVEPTVPAVRRDPPGASDAWPDQEVVPDFDAAPARASAGVARSRFGDTSAPSDTPRAVDTARIEPRLGDASTEPHPAASRIAPGRREPSIDTTAGVSRGAEPPLLEAASIASAATAARGAGVATGTASGVASSAMPSPAVTAPAAVERTPSAAAPSAGGSGLEVRRPAARTAQSPARPVAPETMKPAAEPPSTHQRIVAIRLVAAGGERFEGAQLRAALEGEGLRFGKYSIFHRQRADGRAIYSIASLVEPGSFDPDRMATQRFPGVSMFAVFPGPVAAPEAFDELLATARRLADRLGGVLQDERGGALSAQRVLGIREELVSFQNLVTRVRSRPAG